MTTVSKMITVVCIDCEQPIQLSSRPKLGDLFTCTHCRAELEVIDVDPVELDWAYLEPEDVDDWEWGDNDDEDEDDA